MEEEKCEELQKELTAIYRVLLANYSSYSLALNKEPQLFFWRFCTCTILTQQIIFYLVIKWLISLFQKMPLKSKWKNLSFLSTSTILHYLFECLSYALSYVTETDIWKWKFHFKSSVEFSDMPCKRWKLDHSRT